MPPFLKNPSFTIFDDPSYLSDHKAIHLSFLIDLKDVNLSIKPSIPIKKINFENEQVRNHFFDKVESKLKRKFDFIIRNNFELSVLDQKSIDNLYSDFCNCYVESHDETVKLQESIGPQTISNRISQNKKYLSKESKSTRKALLNAYSKKKALNSEENCKEYHIIKKEYQRIQRRVILTRRRVISLAFTQNIL